MAGGYPNLTTANVAKRAGVSRGAQQHHFPHKATLVAEAVNHLADRTLDQIQTVAAIAGDSRAHLERMLDLLYDLYSGPLFVGMLEVKLAARYDDELAALAAPIERRIARELRGHAVALLGPSAADRPDFDAVLGHVLAQVRGLAVVQRHGAARDRQWQFSRAELVRLLGV